MIQYVKNLERSIDENLYNKLSEKPTEVIKRFYGFNEYKKGFENIFSTFQIKIEKNLAITKRVLEERTK
mgnify:CR=1 FL=1